MISTIFWSGWASSALTRSYVENVSTGVWAPGSTIDQWPVTDGWLPPAPPAPPPPQHAASGPREDAGSGAPRRSLCCSAAIRFHCGLTFRQPVIQLAIAYESPVGAHSTSGC